MKDEKLKDLKWWHIIILCFIFWIIFFIVDKLVNLATSWIQTDLVKIFFREIMRLVITIKFWIGFVDFIDNFFNIHLFTKFEEPLTELLKNKKYIFILLIVVYFLPKNIYFVTDWKNLISMIVVTLLIAYVTAVLEEVLLRGYIFTLLKKKWNYRIAIYAPSLIPILNINYYYLDSSFLMIITAILANIMFAQIVYKTGKIRNAVIIHTILNFIFFGQNFLSSGLEYLKNNIYFIFLNLIENINLLNNNNIGIESSIYAIIVYILAILFLIYVYKKEHIIFPLILTFSLMTVLILFYYFDTNFFFKITENGALSLLGTMTQVLVAILAIVISFSFIGFQLLVPIGGATVLKLFSRDKAFWGLLLVYGFSIFYNLILLRIIPDKNETEILSSLSIWINISILLLYLSFIYLFLYTTGTIRNLEPTIVIHKILKINGKSSNINETIQSITNIMFQALKNDDYDTLFYGLDRLEELYLNIMDNSDLNHKFKLKIARFYNAKISKIIKIAFEQNNEEFVIKTANSLKNIGIETIKINGQIDIVTEIYSILSNFSIIAIEKKLKNATQLLLEAKVSLLIEAYEKPIEGKSSWFKYPSFDDKGHMIVNTNSSMQVSLETSGGKIEFPARTTSSLNQFFINELLKDYSQLARENKIFSVEYYSIAINKIVSHLFIKNGCSCGIILSYLKDYSTVIENFLEMSLEIIDKKDCIKVRPIMECIVDMGIESQKWEDIDRYEHLKNEAKNISQFNVHFKEILKRIGFSHKCAGELINVIGNKGRDIAAKPFQQVEIILICSILQEIWLSYVDKIIDKEFPERDKINQNDFEDLLNRVLYILQDIEKNYRQAESRDITVTEEIIKKIEELGRKSKDCKLENSYIRTLNSIIEISLLTENNSIKQRVCNILKTVEKDPNNKKIFESIILLNENKQEEELMKFNEFFYEFCGLNSNK